MDYQATAEATAKLMKHTGVSSLDELFSLLHIDAHASVGPRYAGPKPPEGSDEFGCRFRDVDYGTGVYNECIHNPLAQFNSVAEVEAGYDWPTADLYDYSVIPTQVEAAGERPIYGGGSEPFLTYCNLRGREQAMMDLVLNKEIVHYCLDRLFDLACENTVRIYEQAGGRALLSYVAEDMGSQEDLMFSPGQIEEFLIPRMKRMIDLARSAGVYVVHHSDGAVRKIIPRMIEIGIDMLNPVQWRAKGMDREGLKRDFGGEVIFHGAVDNQHTLPFGGVEDVRREVVENLRILGAGGGYILAPCHNIQPVGPPENVVAMYEAGYENGWT
jgi:uroporphyrinogen decarboxylase